MLEFHVPDMSCGGCVNAITRALQNVDPQVRVETELEAKQLRVDTAASEQAIRDALAAAGFAAQ